MSKPLTTEEFNKLVFKKYSNRIDTSEVVYVNNHTKCKFICSTHGAFYSTPKSILKKTAKGCPKCLLQSRKKTFEDWVSELNIIHDNKYTYDLSSFKDHKTKMSITCPTHGIFYMSPSEHKKYGCNKCSKEKARHSTISYINRFIKVHGNKYDYTLTSPKTYKDRVNIICKKHGIFEQRVYHHLRGSGCSKCSLDKITKTVDEHINDLKSVHDNEYECIVPDGKLNSSDKVSIVCKKHGVFRQSITNHKSGEKCPKCSNNGQPSILENKIFDYVQTLDNNSKQSYKSIKGLSEIDIYSPKYDIGIEVDGLYWHSDKYKSNNNYHLNKTIRCIENNINLIHIFEDEWILKEEIVKSRLLNLTGKSVKIPARKCTIKEVDSVTSRTFLDKNHLQGFVGAKLYLGLYFENELISLMTFGNLRKNLGQVSTKDHYEMLRFCNKLNTSVIGGASKLFKHFIKTHHPEKVISYADKRWSSGNLYHKLGFKHVGDSRPNYFYLNNSFKERESRFKYRKDILVKQGFDKDKTEKQIMQERGYARIYDCGTMKFEWKNKINELDI